MVDFCLAGQIVLLGKEFSKNIKGFSLEAKAKVKNYANSLSQSIIVEVQSFCILHP